MRSRRSRWKTPRAKNPFASEAALCEELRAAVRELDWTFYPETGGWDAIIVLPDETQIGVQAKLRANVNVLAQTITPLRAPGPDIHAVLVPLASRAFHDVARELDVLVLIGEAIRDRHRYDGLEYLREFMAHGPRRTHLPGRCWLPPYVPDYPAGVPAPRAVTPYRVAAARLCAELREGLVITRAGLKERGLAPSSWCGRWIIPIEGTRPQRFRLDPDITLPDVAFPEVVRALGLPEPIRVVPAAP